MATALRAPGAPPYARADASLEARRRLLLKAVAEGDKREAAVHLAADTANARSEGSHTSALHLAAARGDGVFVTVLLRKGADPNVHETAQAGGDTPLHKAAREGCRAVVHLLMRDGAVDPDARNALGQSALHLAARRGDTQMVEDLLAFGADADMQDRYGKTAYYLAKSVNAPAELLRLLPVSVYDWEATMDAQPPLAVFKNKKKPAKKKKKKG